MAVAISSKILEASNICIEMPLSRIVLSFKITRNEIDEKKHSSGIRVYFEDILLYLNISWQLSTGEAFMNLLQIEKIGRY